MAADRPRPQGRGDQPPPDRIDQFPNNLVDLQNYDAVILNNVPRGAYCEKDDAGGEHLAA